jgi:thioredoxin reductase (NADPH)
MLRSTRKTSQSKNGLPILNNGTSSSIAKNANANALGASHRRVASTRSSSSSSRYLSIASATTLVVLVVTCIYLLTGKDVVLVQNQRSPHQSPHQNQRLVLAQDSIGNGNGNANGTPFFDVVVVGAGPAGLTAALFSARAGLSVLVTGSDAGQLAEAAALDNFPGSAESAGGAAWLATAKRQAAAAGAHFAAAGLLVSKLHQRTDEDDERSLFSLEISSSESLTVHSRAVIVATGATNRRLHLDQETALWGKSVHSCAICDGSAYAHGNQTVLVVGGGDAAVEAALLLSRHAATVVVVHRREEFRASHQRNVEAMRSQPNIHVQTPYALEAYETDAHQNLVAVRLVRRGGGDDMEYTKPTEQMACDGVFVMIGSTPNTDFLKGTVALDAEGLVTLHHGTTATTATSSSVTTTTATSVSGIFAAGEVTDNTYKQAITAAAAGAAAAIDAERWLRQTTVLASPQRLPDNIPLQQLVVVVLEAKADDDLKEKTMIQEERAPVNNPIRIVEYDCDLAQEDCITALVHKHPVVVFSKPWCPFCKKALEALSLDGVSSEPSLHVVNLGDMGARAKVIQATLGKMTGRRTVPNVFVGGRSIGGGDETTSLHRDGRLLGLLEKANAFVVVPQTDEDCEDWTTLSEGCISSLVNKYPVVMFSKPWCPYCRKALEALGMEGVQEGGPSLRVIDVAALGDRGPAVQDTLQKMTGRRTVPNVFVGGTSIGGGDETTGLQREGKLRPLLEQARAYG